MFQIQGVNHGLRTLKHDFVPDKLGLSTLFETSHTEGVKILYELHETLAKALRFTLISQAFVCFKDLQEGSRMDQKQHILESLMLCFWERQRKTEDNTKTDKKN